jgi:hypothetical protein
MAAGLARLGRRGWQRGWRGSWPLGCLVGGDGEGVRESSSSAAPGCLGPDNALGGEIGAAHDSDVRGSSGEVRVEDSARSSAAPHTLIARDKEDADTQGTRLL